MSIVYNLDVRCHEMLKYLLYQDGYTSITQLAEEMNISKRSVYYDIRKINEWMEAQHLSELVVERKREYELTMNKSNDSCRIKDDTI